MVVSVHRLACRTATTEGDDKDDDDDISEKVLCSAWCLGIDARAYALASRTYIARSHKHPKP